MADAHKNFSYSTVATAPSPASSGTSLVVDSGDGALFPAVPFNATVWPADTAPLSTNAEIVRVTNISTDTFTITREQEGSSARSIVVGDQIAATITAKTLTDVEARTAEILVTDPNGDALTTGDGKAYFFVPTAIGGYNLTAAHAAVTTASSSGTPTIQIHNVTQAADMLSTRITIDANEKTSYSAAAAPVIDTGNDDVATGDELRIDVDVAGTGAKRGG